MVVGYRNSYSINCMVPQGVLLSMNGGMRPHSCIAQVDFERKHDMSFIMTKNGHQFIFVFLAK